MRVDKKSHNSIFLYQDNIGHKKLSHSQQNTCTIIFCIIIIIQIHQNKMMVEIDYIISKNNICEHEPAMLHKARFRFQITGQ